MNNTSAYKEEGNLVTWFFTWYVKTKFWNSFFRKECDDWSPSFPTGTWQIYGPMYYQCPFWVFLSSCFFYFLKIFQLLLEECRIYGLHTYLPLLFWAQVKSSANVWAVETWWGMGNICFLGMQCRNLTLRYEYSLISPWNLRYYWIFIIFKTNMKLSPLAAAAVAMAKLSLLLSLSEFCSSINKNFRAKKMFSFKLLVSFPQK